MTFFTPLQQRLSACLAILAVLLLFVAPVVSKDLMARHGGAMAAPVMAMSHSADAMPMMHHMDDAMMPSGHIMSGEEGVACGYCELLVHVPLMIWAAIPLLWLMMLIARATADAARGPAAVPTRTPRLPASCPAFPLRFLIRMPAFPPSKATETGSSLTE